MPDFIAPTELIIKLNLPADTEPTDRALQACAGATAAIRQECGWNIYPAVVGQVYVGTGRVIILPALKVAVTSVVVDGFLRAASRYAVDAAAGVVTLDAAGAVVTVTFDAGYATVPEAVRDVSLEEAAARYGPTGVQREAIDDYSVTYFPPPELKTDPRLRAYRLGPSF